MNLSFFIFFVASCFIFWSPRVDAYEPDRLTQMQECTFDMKMLLYRSPIYDRTEMRRFAHIVANEPQNLDCFMEHYHNFMRRKEQHAKRGYCVRQMLAGLPAKKLDPPYPACVQQFSPRLARYYANVTRQFIHQQNEIKRCTPFFVAMQEQVPFLDVGTMNKLYKRFASVQNRRQRQELFQCHLLESKDILRSTRVSENLRDCYNAFSGITQEVIDDTIQKFNSYLHLNPKINYPSCVRDIPARARVFINFRLYKFKDLLRQFERITLAESRL